MTDSPIVRVEEGELQGRLARSPSGKTYYSFQGIPYAKPPIGSLRFRAPQPPEPWEGVRDATTEGNCCAQVDPNFDREFRGDENCLYLNVYTPNIDGEFLPVMVYIHGGGFQFGTGNSVLYGGDYLTEKDVVVVTINFRLGPLGFLCLNTPEVPGNAALKDIAQALQWVKLNIKSFGGNSGNLTVFGHSSGGATVSLLTASPLTKSHISKAIIQSGVALSSWAFQHKPIENAKALAKELGCESTDLDEILEFLTTTPVRDIIDASVKLNPLDNFLADGFNVFAPVIEKEFPGVEAFITEEFIDILTSGRVANIPIMTGYTSLEFVQERDGDDLQIYIPHDFHVGRNTEESVAIAEEIKKAYFKSNPFSVESLNDRYKLYSDVQLNVNVHRYVKYLLNTTNKPIYFYKFAYVGELNLSNLIPNRLEKNAEHSDELGYIFSTELLKNVEPTPDDVKVRERLLRLWTNFAKESNPTPNEDDYLNVTWLPISKDTMYYLNISNELSIGTNPDGEIMEFWENLYNKYYKIWDNSKSSNVTVETPAVENINVNSFAPVIVEETIVATTESEIIVSKEVEQNNDIEEHTELQEGMEIENVEEPLDQKIEPVQVIDAKEEVKDVEVPDSVKAFKPVEIREYAEINKVNEDNHVAYENGDAMKFNGNVERKPRPSNEIKMVQPNNVNPKDVIRANDPPEDDLPKNIVSTPIAISLASDLIIKEIVTTIAESPDLEISVKKETRDVPEIIITEIGAEIKHEGDMELFDSSGVKTNRVEFDNDDVNNEKKVRNKDKKSADQQVSEKNFNGIVDSKDKSHFKISGLTETEEFTCDTVIKDSINESTNSGEITEYFEVQEKPDNTMNKKEKVLVIHASDSEDSNLFGIDSDSETNPSCNNSNEKLDIDINDEENACNASIVKISEVIENLNIVNDEDAVAKAKETLSEKLISNVKIPDTISKEVSDLAEDVIDLMKVPDLQVTHKRVVVVKENDCESRGFSEQANIRENLTDISFSVTDKVFVQSTEDINHVHQRKRDLLNDEEVQNICNIQYKTQAPIHQRKNEDFEESVLVEGLDSVSFHKNVIALKNKNSEMVSGVCAGDSESIDNSHNLCVDSKSQYITQSLDLIEDVNMQIPQEPLNQNESKIEVFGDSFTPKSSNIYNLSICTTIDHKEVEESQLITEMAPVLAVTEGQTEEKTLVENLVEEIQDLLVYCRRFSVGDSNVGTEMINNSNKKKDDNKTDKLVFNRVEVTKSFEIVDGDSVPTNTNSAERNEIKDNPPFIVEILKNSAVQNYKENNQDSVDNLTVTNSLEKESVKCVDTTNTIQRFYEKGIANNEDESKDNDILIQRVDTVKDDVKIKDKEDQSIGFGVSNEQKCETLEIVSRKKDLDGPNIENDHTENSDILETVNIKTAPKIFCNRLANNSWSSTEQILDKHGLQQNKDIKFKNNNTFSKETPVQFEMIFKDVLKQIQEAGGVPIPVEKFRVMKDKKNVNVINFNISTTCNKISCDPNRESNYDSGFQTSQSVLENFSENKSGDITNTVGIEDDLQNDFNTKSMKHDGVNKNLSNSRPERKKQIKEVTQNTDNILITNSESLCKDKTSHSDICLIEEVSEVPIDLHKEVQLNDKGDFQQTSKCGNEQLSEVDKYQSNIATNSVITDEINDEMELNNDCNVKTEQKHDSFVEKTKVSILENFAETMKLSTENITSIEEKVQSNEINQNNTNPKIIQHCSDDADELISDMNEKIYCGRNSTHMFQEINKGSQLTKKETCTVGVEVKTNPIEAKENDEQLKVKSGIEVELKSAVTTYEQFKKPPVSNDNQQEIYTNTERSNKYVIEPQVHPVLAVEVANLTVAEVHKEDYTFTKSGKEKIVDDCEDNVISDIAILDLKNETKQKFQQKIVQDEEIEVFYVNACETNSTLHGSAINDFDENNVPEHFYLDSTLEKEVKVDNTQPEQETIMPSLQNIREITQESDFAADYESIGKAEYSESINNMNEQEMSLIEATECNKVQTCKKVIPKIEITTEITDEERKEFIRNMNKIENNHLESIEIKGIEQAIDEHILENDPEYISDSICVLHEPVESINTEEFVHVNKLVVLNENKANDDIADELNKPKTSFYIEKKASETDEMEDDGELNFDVIVEAEAVSKTIRYQTNEDETNNDVSKTIQEVTALSVTETDKDKPADLHENVVCIDTANPLGNDIKTDEVLHKIENETEKLEENDDVRFIGSIEILINQNNAIKGNGMKRNVAQEAQISFDDISLQTKGETVNDDTEIEKVSFFKQKEIEFKTRKVAHIVAVTIDENKTTAFEENVEVVKEITHCPILLVSSEESIKNEDDHVEFSALADIRKLNENNWTSQNDDSELLTKKSDFGDDVETRKANVLVSGSNVEKSDVKRISSKYDRSIEFHDIINKQIVYSNVEIAQETPSNIIKVTEKSVDPSASNVDLEKTPNDLHLEIGDGNYSSSVLNVIETPGEIIAVEKAGMSLQVTAKEKPVVSLELKNGINNSGEQNEGKINYTPGDDVDLDESHSQSKNKTNDENEADKKIKLDRHCVKTNAETIFIEKENDCGIEENNYIVGKKIAVTPDETQSESRNGLNEDVKFARNAIDNSVSVKSVKESIKSNLKNYSENVAERVTAVKSHENIKDVVFCTQEVNIVTENMLNNLPEEQALNKKLLQIVPVTYFNFNENKEMKICKEVRNRSCDLKNNLKGDYEVDETCGLNVMPASGNYCETESLEVSSVHIDRNDEAIKRAQVPFCLQATFSQDSEEFYDASDKITTEMLHTHDEASTDSGGMEQNCNKLMDIKVTEKLYKEEIDVDSAVQSVKDTLQTKNCKKVNDGINANMVTVVSKAGEKKCIKQNRFAVQLMPNSEMTENNINVENIPKDKIVDEILDENFDKDEHNLDELYLKSLFERNMIQKPGNIDIEFEEIMREYVNGSLGDETELIEEFGDKMFVHNLKEIKNTQESKDKHSVQELIVKHEQLEKAKPCVKGAIVKEIDGTVFTSDSGIVREVANIIHMNSATVSEDKLLDKMFNENPTRRRLQSEYQGVTQLQNTTSKQSKRSADKIPLFLNEKQSLNRIKTSHLQLEELPTEEHIEFEELFQNLVQEIQDTDASNSEDPRDIALKEDIIELGNSNVCAEEKMKRVKNCPISLPKNGKSRRPSKEVKILQPGFVNPANIVRANDPPEDDLPKNFDIYKYVQYYESLIAKK